MAADHSAPQTLAELRAALAAGQRRFTALPLLDLNGCDKADLDLTDCDFSGCDLRGACFQEARLGHARLRQGRADGTRFQQALLWGADLSGLRAVLSFWHEADLSGARL